MSATRNPIQPKPRSLPGNLKDKTGPGTLRTADSVTGPTIQTPRINQSAQSSRSNEAERAGAHGSGLGENPRVVDRAGLSLGQHDNYGIT